MARVHREPDIPADLPTGWQQLLAAMTRRDPSARPTAPQVAGELRRLAAGEPLASTVVAGAVASPAATTVMPPVSVQTQAMAGPVATTMPPVQAGRRGPTRAVIVVMLLVVVAVAAAVLIAVQRSGNGSGGSARHGTPHLHQPLERDVRHLENLVHP
jgi:hypothetical protein